MNIIVHLPTTTNGHKELTNRIAKLHAEATLKRVRSSGYSEQHQKQILSNVIAKAREQIPT